MPEPPPRPSAFTDIPLGTGLSPEYTRHRFRVSLGDYLLLITDGVLETPSADDVPFDTEGLAALLARESGDPAQLSDHLLGALYAHAGRRTLSHDDVTFLLSEIVEGPRGPALWHVVKNRLLRRSTTHRGSSAYAPALRP